MDIIIRRLEPNDYEAMQKIFAGPKVVWGTLQLPYPSIEIWRNRIAEVPNDMFRLAAMVGTEMAGQLDLFTSPNHPRRRHAGQIGMSVRDDFHGQGVGSALMQAATDLADNWLNIQRLELEVYCDNKLAVRLYKKFGFEVEGTMKGYAFRAGEFVNLYAMARIRLK